MPDACLTATAAPSRLIRLPEVCQLVGLSRSAVLSRCVAGTFPQRFSLGARAVAWREADVQAWIFEHTRTPAVQVAPIEATRAAATKTAQRRTAAKASLVSAKSNGKGGRTRKATRAQP